MLTANYAADELHEWTVTEEVSIKEEGDYVAVEEAICLLADSLEELE